LFSDCYPLMAVCSWGSAHPERGVLRGIDDDDGGGRLSVEHALSRQR